ncbi:MAG: hypothetical protein AB1473_19930 [Thermodesulfobacteriota bacterium]
MSVERIETLIRTAREVIDSDFDIRVIYRWKKEALEYLQEQLGPDHYYTRCFSDHMAEMEQQHLLTGTGVLDAVRAQMSQSSNELSGKQRGYSFASELSAANRRKNARSSEEDRRDGVTIS